MSDMAEVLKRLRCDIEALCSEVERLSIRECDLIRYARHGFVQSKEGSHIQICSRCAFHKDDAIHSRPQ